MKKNVFSRTLAVLASTAVLGAASMMTANADQSISLGSAEAQPGETVNIPVVIACDDNFESLDCVVAYDGALTAAAAVVGDTGIVPTSNVFDDNTVSVVAYGSAAIADGAIAYIPFTVPEDAEVGTTYDISFASVNNFFVFGGDDLAGSVSQAGGQITVVAAPTEPVADTTAAPEETTAAATTAAATTAAPKAAAATGSPKTGTAGVAVAVAGLVTAGATAVVLKKRH